MKISPPPSKQPIPNHAKRVFQGKIFSVFQWQQKLFDGSTTTFEKIKRPATVMVLPITDDQKILLSYQEQPGHEPFIGAVGGVVDEGEDVLAAAKRELLEETGMTTQTWTLWDSVQLINKIDWPVYTFVCKSLKQEQAQQLDGGERVELQPYTFEQFVSLCYQDTFRDHEIILKVLKAQANSQAREALRQSLFG